MTKKDKALKPLQIFYCIVLSCMVFRVLSFADITASYGKNLLVNPDMSEISERVPKGWNLRGNNLKNDTLYVFYDAEEKASVISMARSGNQDAVTQTVVLSPGHYIFRALVKASNYHPNLIAREEERPPEHPHSYYIGPYIAALPIGISDEYRWVELPFCVGHSDNGDTPVAVAIGIPYGQVSVVKTEVRVKQTELIKLGETALKKNWVQSMPSHSLHGLETIDKHSDWERPGKVIFHDTFLGTELWLMTQGGRAYVSYVGSPDFSSDGRYVQAGRLSPGSIMRTDGSMRYNPPERHAWRDILWLFPWEEKRLPEGADPADWIVPVRTADHVDFLHLPTGKTHRFSLPSRPGWDIIHYPSFPRHDRGPDIKNTTYETIVWQSDNSRSIALSDMEGKNFRTFGIKSISSVPEKDIVYPLKDKGPEPLPRDKQLPVGWAVGKNGDNWRNAVDRYGRRYFVFELNRGNSFQEKENPYQLWAVCLDIQDERGLLMVVPNPRAKIARQGFFGKTKVPILWWDFAAGLPRSGDEAILILEDGTMVHMSSLGMHSGFNGTVKTQCPYANETTFIGSYPEMDRISWPHEFKHDKHFAVVESFAEPQSPVVMIDLENSTLWTLSVSNFYDYYVRYRRQKPGKGKMRMNPTPSPDFTKVIYNSSMLAGEYPDRPYADAYIAVARYPQPPVNVRVKEEVLVWERPRYCRETRGYNIYFSRESGRGYRKLNGEPVKETRYPLSGRGDGFYVVTSVEHSGLESRNFSNEASVGSGRVFRLFHQAEDSKITGPMVPFFEPKGASNLYAVAVTDPELIYKKQLEEGLEGSVKAEIDIPVSGRCIIMGRVRGMSQLERSSYTSGWGPSGDAVSGSFRVKINGREIGSIAVEGFEWKWVKTDALALVLPAGSVELEFSTSDAGIAMDNILVTNDPDFEPGRKGNAPAGKLSAPSGVRIEELTRILQMKVIKHMDNRLFLLYNKGKTAHTKEKPNG